MTGQERDYEAILSRVLHTTTDQFEPVGDGLTKIRTRLGEPWLKRQWWLLRSELMVLRWLVVVRCESLFSRIRSRSDVTDLAPDAPAGQEAEGGPLRSLLNLATLTQAKQPRRSAGPAMAWFRPALAVAGAVVLVVAGVFALGSIRTVVGLDAGTGTNSSTTGQQNGNGNANGSGSQFPGSGTSSQGGSGAPSPGASAGHNRTLPSSTPCAAASPPAQNSPSPSPPPPTSPPPSSPPPSSPPPSSPPPSSPPPSSPPPTSGAPLTSGIAGHTQEAIGTTALVMCEPTPGAPASPSNQAPSGQ
jgi:hypothetical protein